MHSALHSAIGFPRRFTIASLMIAFLMPAEVSKAFMGLLRCSTRVSRRDSRTSRNSSVYTTVIAASRDHAASRSEHCAGVLIRAADTEDWPRLRPAASLSFVRVGGSVRQGPFAHTGAAERSTARPLKRAAQALPLPLARRASSRDAPSRKEPFPHAGEPREP